MAPLLPCSKEEPGVVTNTVFFSLGTYLVPLEHIMSYHLNLTFFLLNFCFENVSENCGDIAHVCRWGCQ